MREGGVANPRPVPARLSIAVLSYGLPTIGRKRGGIERVAHDLAHALARRGHAVTVWSHDPKPEGAAYAVQPLPWQRFVHTWVGRRATMGYLGNVLMVRVDTGDADVVIAHGDSLLLPLRRRPFVRVMHGTAWQEARTATSPGRALLQAGVFAQELAAAALHRPTVGVSWNTRAANPFVSHVIPNGVDRAVFHPDEGERSASPLLVFVGAMGGRKRGAWLLDQFARIVRPAVPAELAMVSASGPASPGVTYWHGLSDAALASLYRRAWLCVSPSTYEGFGLPYVEALACGTPVVATPNPGSTEVLGQGGGLLCRDVDFAPMIVELLRDHARRDALRIAGLAAVERYDLERTVDAYEQLLTDLARRHRRTTHA